MAILISLPIVILALLDISSYGIARTLGVIEDVKASTSDKPTIHAVSSSDTPVIRITGSLTPSSTDSLLSDSDFESMTNHSLHNRMRSPLSDSVEMSASESSSQDSQPSVYYAGEDTSLKLAGVGLFSPAASQPPSPTISRRHLPQEEQLRHRIQQANGTIEE
ncbi:hypothetical protein NLJ89_g2801 [Agrocybe chaxingu]|uniref:Uncharacterized protein n=1 Tax=Agrocybe chaxingu TaxID=84603 RepID=A0A9W8K655_9AGAR|nr:hypothetical protein NLJ89_g2801 [Agrocybe chaxingu]